MQITRPLCFLPELMSTCGVRQLGIYLVSVNRDLFVTSDFKFSLDRKFSLDQNCQQSF